MRAVLMAGGSGTRLRPLTCELPKPMVPVLNRPIAEHIVRLLKHHHIREVITTLYYLPDVMRSHFQDGREFGIQMTYAVEEEQPLGTAGCVKNVSELLGSTFLVISGDCITDFDLSAAIAFHYQKKSIATLVLTRVPNPLEFGVVITGPDGRIQRFLEKPSSSEVFSDTVNTGIYILEPEVLNYLSPKEEADFSKDLFPFLLAQRKPLYGYIAEGYWCDVGHLDAYRESQYSALAQRVNLEVSYPHRSPSLWIGQNTYIDPTVNIEPPVLIGNNCRIGSHVHIEPGTIIGDNVTIGSHATLKRPIIWNGAIIGDESHLRACVVGRGTRIDRRAHILEGAIVGSLSTVGEEARVSPQVRVWPNKRIEAGAILNLNLIWGNVGHRNLFGQRGVSGLANIDITPELAVKLGAAYGSTLSPGSEVTVSRDQRSISRMVTRSLVAGLMSVGVDVQNLENKAIPIVRTVIPTLGVEGGIHVRLHPERGSSILIEFLNHKGINISKSKEKKIEGCFFKEDMRRSLLYEVGNVTYTSETLQIYMEAFEKHLNLEAIETVSSKVVIDYVFAVSGAVLPQLLAKFGCDAVVLNASLNPKPLSLDDQEGLLNQLGRVVGALEATMGVQVSSNGEKFVLIDETGTAIRGEILTALMMQMILTAHPRGTVVVPIHASSAVEEIARRHEGRVIRTKSNPAALMEACHANPNVVLGGSGDMGFIFPQLHPGFDAMFATAKLMEMLKLQDISLGTMRSKLPPIAHQMTTLRCPWTAKGAVMRYLVETHSSEQLQLVDGVKIISPDGHHWVLILPDAGEAMIDIVADGCDPEIVESLLKDYGDRVHSFIEAHQRFDD
ncbi:MAG: mannose-1-phosphate guanyltransferase [Roseofilum sp. SBFL]|uniref:mannose-1-phosphate guanyltransferase n=1 Tax=unclassified Roseofilum TaxID=2620099 RepID=UPI001B140FA5|nr:MULTISPECIES: mannose-1-phosphate guanyltransferase [unclassified Roseofilum]MBP0015266.1 mannose-1-phosphate guanyltransferase [Roseofilum sp. SID3]MBP0022392.1 mannose-1-phosphate guanyltransferase [Roseofilum sp. SID2]MBP0036252.1 mannose-1-phosphate guanyltransferase [Roseofilum sp. SID1]MBP0044834.1 mannose-1-phosphate guanyltransferase [Roseofilum sp. SBFL]